MQSKVSKGNDEVGNHQPIQAKKINNNKSAEHKQQSQPVQAKTMGKVQTMFGSKPPIQTKEGLKPPIRAKQRPIQRHTGDNLKSTMGEQYGVDLSNHTEHKDSSFPDKVGALATIQGKDIHYAPGQFTLQNRKHELGHAIDNAKNGTPKGDTSIGGHNIDTTREAAADKIMNAPLQRKTEGESNHQTTQVNNNSGNNVPIQRLTRDEVPKVIRKLKRKHPQIQVTEEELWADFQRYTARFHENNTMELGMAVRFMSRFVANYIISPDVRGRAGSTLSTLTELEELMNRGVFNVDTINRLRHNPEELAAFSEELHLQATQPRQEEVRGKGDDSKPLRTLQSSRRVLLRDEDPAHYLRRLMAEAVLSKPEFDSKLAQLQGALSSSFDINAEKKEGPLKGWSRAFAKATRKTDTPDMLLDLVRGSLIFESVQDLVQAQDFIINSGIFETVKGYGTLGKTSGWGSKGYQDMKLAVRLSTGHIAELQLHIRAMAAIKDEKGGHELYNFIRAGGEEYEYRSVDIEKSLEDLNSIKGMMMEYHHEHERHGEHLSWIERMQDRIREQVGTQLAGNDLKLAKEISDLLYSEAHKEVQAVLNSDDHIKTTLARFCETTPYRTHARD